MSYSEGAHNSPADTKDRLVRIGTKYQATPSTVADGDNVYLAVTSTGEVIVDRITTDVDLTLDGQTPARGAAVASLPYYKAPDGSKDHARSLGDTAGSGLGVQAAAPWIPGASDVKTNYARSAASTTRATIVTPQSGKKIRMVGLMLHHDNTTATRVEVYFGTGTNIATDATKAIAEVLMDSANSPNEARSWPDGGGPVGAVDDVLSIRASDANGNIMIIPLFREE